MLTWLEQKWHLNGQCAAFGGGGGGWVLNKHNHKQPVHIPTRNSVTSEAQTVSTSLISCLRGLGQVQREI